MADEHASCWMCDRWAYTLVFWSRPFAKIYKEPDLSDQNKKIKAKIVTALRNFQADAPLITNSAYDWQAPHKMLTINEFTSAIDKSKPEYV